MLTLLSLLTAITLAFFITWIVKGRSSNTSSSVAVPAIREEEDSLVTSLLQDTSAGDRREWQGFVVTNGPTKAVILSFPSLTDRIMFVTASVVSCVVGSQTLTRRVEIRFSVSTDNKGRITYSGPGDILSSGELRLKNPTLENAVDGHMALYVYGTDNHDIRHFADVSMVSTPDV